MSFTPHRAFLQLNKVAFIALDFRQNFTFLERWQMSKKWQNLLWKRFIWCPNQRLRFLKQVISRSEVANTIAIITLDNAFSSWQWLTDVIWKELPLSIGNKHHCIARAHQVWKGFGNFYRSVVAVAELIPSLFSIVAEVLATDLLGKRFFLIRWKSTYKHWDHIHRPLYASVPNQSTWNF